MTRLEQVVSPTSGNHAQTCREDIEEWGGVAIQTIQSHENGGWGKPDLRRIAFDHPDRSLQFATIIPIARPAERAEELMRMSLENHGPCTNHFSSLASGVA